MKLDTTPGKKRTSDEHRAESLVHAEKMLDAESDYFAALKKFHKTKGFHSVLGDQFNPDGRKLPGDVQAKKDAWIKARADYAGFMRGHATEQHIARHKNFERKDGKMGIGGATSKLLSHAVMERYQRRFITKEVVLGAEEAEYRARMEGLSSRDKKGIEKFFSQFKSLPTILRTLSTSAMIAGGVGAVVAGSTIGGAAMLALGATSAITTIAAAKSKEGSAAKSFWTKAATVASIGGIFGFLGDKTIRGVHSGLGTKKNAVNKLAQREGLGDLSNPDTFKKVAGSRKKATLVQEKIDAHARLGRVAAATAGGAIVGGVLHHGLDHGSIHHSGGASGGTPEYPHDHESLAVGGKIYDADRLMGHFGDKLQHDFPPGSIRPPAVQKFLETMQAAGKIDPAHQHPALWHEDHASIFGFHFEGKSGISTIMHPGDKVSFEHGQIILERPGHPGMTHVLVDDKGTLNPVDAKVWHQAMPHPHHAEAHEAVSGATPNPLDAAASPHAPAGPVATETDPDVPPTATVAMPVHHEAAPAPAAIAQPSPVVPEHPVAAPAPSHVENSDHGISIEKASEDAIATAKAAPAGAEVSFVSHAGGPAHWSVWVSD